MENNAETMPRNRDELEKACWIEYRRTLFILHVFVNKIRLVGTGCATCSGGQICVSMSCPQRYWYC